MSETAAGKRAPPALDVPGLLAGLGLPVPPGDALARLKPALEPLLQNLLPTYTVKSSVDRLYRCADGAVQAVSTLPQVRVRREECALDVDSAASLRLLMPDTDPALRLEQLRFLLFERQLVPLAASALVERCYYSCAEARACWPLKDCKARLGSVVLRRATGRAKDTGGAEAVQRQRDDVEALLRREGLLADQQPAPLDNNNDAPNDTETDDDAVVKKPKTKKSKKEKHRDKKSSKKSGGKKDKKERKDKKEKKSSRKSSKDKAPEATKKRKRAASDVAEPVRAVSPPRQAFTPPPAPVEVPVAPLQLADIYKRDAAVDGQATRLDNYAQLRLWFERTHREYDKMVSFTTVQQQACH